MTPYTVLDILTGGLKIAAFFDPALAPVAALESQIAGVIESPEGRRVASDVLNVMAAHGIHGTRVVEHLNTLHDKLTMRGMTGDELAALQAAHGQD